jgi:hypothetical protein
MTFPQRRLVLRARLQACRPVFADFPSHQRRGLSDEHATVGDPPPLGVEHVLILVPALEVRVDRFGPRHKLVQLAAAAGALARHFNHEVAHHVMDVRQRAVHIAGEGDECCAALDPQAQRGHFEDAVLGEQGGPAFGRTVVDLPGIPGQEILDHAAIRSNLKILGCATHQLHVLPLFTMPNVPVQRPA